MKKTNRILSMLLAVIMVVVMLPLSTMTAFAVEGTDYTVSEDDGVKTYTVYTATGLQEIGTLINSDDNLLNANITLAADITLPSVPDNKSNWTPIGDYDTPYTGTFNGSGHTISGLKIPHDSGVQYVGLFGVVKDAKIFDITVASGQLVAIEYCGGIAGAVYHSEFSNCINTGVTVYTKEENTGGIVGYAENSTFVDCHNSAKIWTNYLYESAVGGIVGTIRLTEAIGEDTVVLSHCTNSGFVENGTNVPAGCTGGIVGVCYGYSDNDFDNDNSNYENVSAGRRVFHAIIKDCINDGDVTSYELATGGILGYGEVVLLGNCTNNGTITGLYSTSGSATDVPNGSEVGGIAGMLTSYCGVTNCHNTGDITGVGMVGGVIGGIYALYSDCNVTVDNCTNSGTVTATLTAEAAADGDYDPILFTDTTSGDTYYSFSHIASAGGIVGLTMDSCFSGVGMENYLGGKVLIRNCTNTGAVKAETAPVAGGIAGYLCGAQVEDCCNQGTVTALDAAGVFAGHLYDNNGHTASVSANADIKTGHSPLADDGDCTTAEKCSCGHIITEAEANHTGGTATCTDKAKCEVCNKEYGDLAAHTYKNGKCTVCEAVDPNYKSSSPQTGDNSNRALWIALLLVSGMGVVATTVYGRKKRTN